MVFLRWQPRISLDPGSGGDGNPRFRGCDGNGMDLTGLHIQPGLAVGDVSARQALMLLLVRKNQMLRGTLAIPSFFEIKESGGA
jgi:hypothetical protein